MLNRLWLIPVLNFAEYIIDNAIRDTVDEPAIGSVVYCELMGGLAEHSGIYVGDNTIVHLNGDGWVEAVTPEEFIDRLDGFNTAMSIYTSCVDTIAVGSEQVAKHAMQRLGEFNDYNLLSNNCHQFTASCLDGDLDNICNLMGSLKWKTWIHLDSDTWRFWEVGFF